MATLKVSVEKLLVIFEQPTIRTQLTLKEAERASGHTLDACHNCGRCSFLQATIKSPEIIEVVGEAAGDGPNCDLVGLGAALGPFPLPEGKVPASKIESESDTFRNNLATQIG